MQDTNESRNDRWRMRMMVITILILVVVILSFLLFQAYRHDPTWKKIKEWFLSRFPPPSHAGAGNAPAAGHGHGNNLKV